MPALSVATVGDGSNLPAAGPAAAAIRRHRAASVDPQDGSGNGVCDANLGKEQLPHIGDLSVTPKITTLES